MKCGDVKCPASSQKWIGINVAGFDQSDKCDTGFACIANAQLDWLLKSQINIFRSPIMPTRFFTSPPVPGETPQLSLFCPTFTDQQGDKVNSCDPCNGYYRPATYMSAVRYTISKKTYVIIDAHDNDKHLDTFPDVPLTPDRFLQMWRLVTWFCDTQFTDDEKKYLLFELFNEPVGNIYDNQGNNIASDPVTQWNTSYILPTLQMIRKTSTFPFKILVTTWGDWSGYHSWAEDSSKTLVPLLKTIQGQTNVFLATHQYCDSDFSGTHTNCTQDFQNAWSAWTTTLSPLLTSYGIPVILTEGNPLCPQKDSCPNGSFYIDFVRDLFQHSWCQGATVWMSNTGADFGGTNMGTGCPEQPRQFENYSAFYQVTSGSYPTSVYRFQHTFL
jgi:hypothetical protein